MIFDVMYRSQNWKSIKQKNHEAYCNNIQYKYFKKKKTIVQQQWQLWTWCTTIWDIYKRK